MLYFETILSPSPPPAAPGRPSAVGTVRPATSADVEPVRRLLLESFGRYRPVIGEDLWRYYAAEMRVTHADVPQFLVIEAEGTVVAAGRHLPPTAAGAFPADTSTLQKIAVHPTVEGRGL